MQASAVCTLCLVRKKVSKFQLVPFHVSAINFERRLFLDPFSKIHFPSHARFVLWSNLNFLIMNLNEVSFLV